MDIEDKLWAHSKKESLDEETKKLLDEAANTIDGLHASIVILRSDKETLREKLNRR